jgi:hypothetical protein
MDKQLNSLWFTSNPKVTLFNVIYYWLFAVRTSGSDDNMLLKVAKESFHNKLSEMDIKVEYMWHALCYRPKRCIELSDDDSSDTSKWPCLNMDGDYSSTRLIVSNRHTILAMIGQEHYTKVRAINESPTKKKSMF